MSKQGVGLAMMSIGIAAMAAGLGLGAYNLWDDHRAGLQADALLQTIVQYRESNADPGSLEADGYRLIGTVSIPAITVTLPVQEDWSPGLLKVSPCRYTGSPEQRDLIICGHNYAAHFGRLKNLLPGDEVVFTNLAGDSFRYTVTELETLADTAAEEMESGSWDLTLFTCTLGGQERVTARCALIENTGV